MELPDPQAIPTPYRIAWDQANRAIEEVSAPESGEVGLPWTSIAQYAGPLRPGDLWIVAARTGDGKTTFLMNWIAKLAQEGVKWLYLGTETPPEGARLSWAAWRCGIPVWRALENRLEADERDELVADLKMQANLYAYTAHFAESEHRYPSVREVEAQLDYARSQGVRVVVLDHIHRIRHDGPRSVTLGLSDAVRLLKERAVADGMSVVAAAQLARPADKSPLASLAPAPLAALKWSGSLEEESDVVLMLHRPRRAGLKAADLKAAAAGDMAIEELVEPERMAVRIAKHRRRGHYIERQARLRLSQGVLEELV